MKTKKPNQKKQISVKPPDYVDNNWHWQFFCSGCGTSVMNWSQRKAKDLCTYCGCEKNRKIKVKTESENMLGPMRFFAWRYDYHYKARFISKSGPISDWREIFGYDPEW